MKRSNRTQAESAKRIFIVDDHPMTRYGISQLISQQQDLEVCGEAGDAKLALASLKQAGPDLVVADLTMPDKNGLDLTKDIKEKHPGLPVLVVSMHEESIYAERVFRAGGRGYVMKSAGGEKLLEAIRQVLSGQTYLSETMSSRIVEMLSSRRQNAGDSMVSLLSDRELGVLELLGQGLTTNEIAKHFGISGKTVATYRMNIVKKLKLKNSELAKFAIRWVRAQQLV